MSTSDEQIIAKYQYSGEKSDLDELFERHLSRVRNVAYRISLCNTMADDVTQEVFMKVIRSAHGFRGEASFSTWIYRITVNTAKEFLRKQSQVRKSQGELFQQNHRLSERPDQVAMFGETITEVEQALAKLSPKLRTAIVLTALEQLSPKEAATIEGCTTATMHWRIHQARKQLKRLLHPFLKT